MKPETSVQKTWRGPEEATGMDKVINVRLPMAEKVALQQMAFQAGLSLSALVRRCCWGRKVVTDPALGIMEYLRRGARKSVPRTSTRAIKTGCTFTPRPPCAGCARR